MLELKRAVKTSKLETRQTEKPGQPETGQPETGQPETGQPGTGQPGTGQPETGQPETGQPEPGQLRSEPLDPNFETEAARHELGQPQSETVKFKVYTFFQEGSRLVNLF